MIKRLEVEGLVAPERGKIRLTATGTELAERVVRRHRLAERFLTDILGLSWADAHQRGGQVGARDVGRRSEQAMDRVLGGPTTCPHGNPIPGSDYHAPDATPPGRRRASATAFTVSRIPEELEFTPGPARLPGVVVDPARSLGPGHRGLAGRHDDRGDRRSPRRRRQLRQRPHPRHRLSPPLRRRPPLRFGRLLLAALQRCVGSRGPIPTPAAAARGSAPGRSGGWSRAASPASRRAPPPRPGCSASSSRVPLSPTSTHSAMPRFRRATASCSTARSSSSCSATVSPTRTGKSRCMLGTPSK